MSMIVKKDHSCQDHHDHDHEHHHQYTEAASSCSHHHHHGKQPVILYVVGLVLYFIALLSPLPESLSNLLMLSAMVVAGYQVIFEGIGETITESIRLKKFWPNVHILMTLAAIGAVFLGDYDEGALLILIFSGAHFLEEYAEGRSKREITALLKMNPTKARLRQENGEYAMVEVETLKIGDQLKVLPGDQVPTDGVILEGSSTLNESSINGESMPQEKTVGAEVYGSTINGQGTFTMTVTKVASDTIFAKILTLVNQSQSRLSPTATKIKQIEPLYVKTVLAIVPLFILSGIVIFQWGWYPSFYRGMVLMISASTCALAASAIPASLSGISNLAKRGVLFKGGSYLANLADVQAVAFDKTGTLTQGNPAVTDVYFIDETKASDWTKIIVSMENSANHPLAKAMLRHFDQVSPIALDVQNDIGKGLKTIYEGKEYKIGKQDFFANIASELLVQTERLTKLGKNVVFFGENDHVVGYLAMMDLPQPTASSVIDYLNTQGIQTVMITGDATLTGQAVGDLLGISRVKGNVLPEQKSTIITELQQQYGKTVMLGDGINDAPALAQAHISFAMAAAGSDTAVEAANIALMDADLRKIPQFIRLSQGTATILKQNISFAIAIKMVFLVLAISGQATMWMAVFADLGASLLVILNSLRLLKAKS